MYKFKKLVEDTLQRYQKTTIKNESIPQEKTNEFLNKVIESLKENRFCSICKQDDSVVLNEYLNSINYVQNNKSLKQVLEEALQKTDPRLDDYYQKVLYDYYIKFVQIIRNYPKNNAEAQMKSWGELGIEFKIYDQVIRLLDKNQFKVIADRKIGTYDESEKVLYLFLLNNGDNLTIEDKTFCLSEQVKLVFFHEMSHKLDSDALKGNNKDSFLTQNKEYRKREKLGIEQKPISNKAKYNTDYEFNATLSVFISYISQLLKNKGYNKNRLAKELSSESIDKYVKDIINTIKDSDESTAIMLWSLYDRLNDQNKNRLINSLNKYYSSNLYDW